MTALDTGHIVRLGRPPDGAGAGLARVALLDCAGTIVAASDDWLAPGRLDGDAPGRADGSTSFLGRWLSGGDEPDRQVVRAALRGEVLTPRRIRASRPPGGPADGLAMVVSSRFDDAGRPLGATVLLEADPPRRPEDRSRALARAITTVISELDLDAVLRRVPAAARDLVGADYAVLDLLGDDGSAPQTMRAGAAPDPRRVVTTVVAPIQRDGLLGHLEVGRCGSDGFADDAEQLLRCLADTAAFAIARARSFERSERRRRWQTVTGMAPGPVVRHDGGPLRATALGYLMRAADADFALTARSADGRLVVVEVVGTLAGAGSRGEPPLDLAVLEPVLGSDHAQVVVPGWASQTHPDGRPGQLIAASVDDGDRARVVVAVGRDPGRTAFDPVDLEGLGDFLTQVDSSLRLERAWAESAVRAVHDEHDRIAADLHRGVVRELFAIAMGLESMIDGLDRPEQRLRVSSYVDAVDEAIRRMRGSILALRFSGAADRSLEDRVLAVLDEGRPVLGFSVAADFSGVVPGSLPRLLVDDVVAVVREAVDNAAAHASASTVSVRVASREGHVVVDVVDDGVGPGPLGRFGGLAVLRRTAQQQGGDLELAATSSGGTHLRWTARLPG